MSDIFEMVTRLLAGGYNLTEAEKFAESAKLEDALTDIRQARETIQGIADKYFEECKGEFAETGKDIKVRRRELKKHRP